MDFKSVEVKKLVEFAYYLHESGMRVYCKYDLDKSTEDLGFIPIVEEGISGTPIKKLDNGAVCGNIVKEFGHSSAIPSLILDVIIGKHIERGFIYDMAIRFHLEGSLSNEYLSSRHMNILMLKPDLSDCPQEDFPIMRGKEKKGFFDFDNGIPPLVIDGGVGDFDDDNVFDNIDVLKKMEIFVRAMEVVGFRIEDVIALLGGEKNAEEVFMAVAPLEIAKRRIVYWNQRKYTFLGNVLSSIVPLDAEVSADIGTSLDELPFPFEGPAIIDAFLVDTYGIDFGENARGHKLVNVNSKKYAIYRAKLKNAIIEEAIDLEKVDASDTEFGHQVVINVDRSIGNLSYTDFSYAVDEKGNRFATDEYGRLKENETENPISGAAEPEPITKKDMDILVDASDYSMALEGFDNGADGIGLIRIEDMLKINGIPIYTPIFTTKEEEKRKDVIDRCGDILHEKANKMLSAANGKRVVFRLLDAKLGEVLTENQIYNYFLSETELRGDAALCKYPEVLELQTRAILEAALKTGAEVDILVPINSDICNINTVKNTFKKVALEIGWQKYRIGAMIEYVWFANRADYVSSRADFISFGLNDLTESVTGLKRASRDECFAILDERVKSLIRESVYRARIANPDIEIGFCGLHTSFANNLEFFEEVGADYITCSANFIPTAKRLLLSKTSKREGEKGTCISLKKLKNNEIK